MQVKAIQLLDSRYVSHILVAFVELLLCNNSDSLCVHVCVGTESYSR
jgi:hypothetical protein